MQIALISALNLIFSCATSEPISIEELTANLSRQDVVFLGEEHDNTQGHKMQLAIVQSLHKQRKDMVISLEMFERDVQGVLNDYLRGRIDEATFLAHSRPWPNYKRHYRPIVEYAREHGLDVIAANAPRRSARKVAQGGGDPSMHVARSTTAPKNQYWLLFKEAMKDHPGEIPESALHSMYAAQCLKDDTMAESIVDYMISRPHRRPLIVHLCGKFHSDLGLGTHARVLQRSPLTRTSVVSMESFEDRAETALKTAKERGHYLIAVPKEPSKESQATAKAKQPNQEEKPKEEERELLPAGLGIMPDYSGEDPGVLVNAVSEDGAAEAAGIKANDLIIKIGKESIESLEDYMAVMADHYAGDKVKVTVERGDAELVLDVTLSARRR